MPPPGHRFDAEYRSQSAPGWSPATVRFDVRGLIIEARESGESRVWPFASLTSHAAVPIEGSNRVVLTSTIDAAATLTVDSAQFVASLLQAAPQLRKAQPRSPSWLPMVLATLAVLALIAALIWAVFAMFPYKAIAKRIPEDTRASIGALALGELKKGRKTCTAPAGTAALARLVDRLSRASQTDIRFKVQVIDWSLVNAFAVMGNQIVLTRGLIEKAGSAEEVAGVLGHEMGHAIEMHPEAAVLRALGTTIGLQVLFGGWSPDLVTQAASQLLLLRYSRANEMEADEVALRILRRAGIAAAPFAGFFDRIGRIEEPRTGNDQGFRLPNVFQTHPPSPERARRVRAEPPYPSTPALEDGEWLALRQICGATP